MAHKTLEDFREEERNRKVFEEEQKIIKKMEEEGKKMKEELEIDQDAAEWKRLSRELDDDKLTFDNIIFWKKAIVESLPDMKTFRDKSAKSKKYLEDVNFRVDLKERLEQKQEEILEKEREEMRKRDEAWKKRKQEEIEYQNQFYK